MAAAAASSNPGAMEQPDDAMRQLLRQFGLDRYLEYREGEERLLEPEDPEPEQPNHVIYVRRIGPNDEAEEFEQWYQQPQPYNRIIRMDPMPMRIAGDVDSDDEDHNLMAGMNMHINRRPPPKPTPSQLDTFQNCMKVGFFVATVEALNDRADGNIAEIRKFAAEKVEELINSTGEVREPEVEGQPICGTPKIERDLRRMSKHIGYFKELFAKFLEEFDGSRIRLHKLRCATGIIKGMMAFLGKRIYNNTKTPLPGNHDIDIDIFTVNANLFIEFLESYE